MESLPQFPTLPIMNGELPAPKTVSYGLNWSETATRKFLGFHFGKVNENQSDNVRDNRKKIYELKNMLAKNIKKKIGIHHD